MSGAADHGKYVPGFNSLLRLLTAPKEHTGSVYYCSLPFLVVRLL
jgi:hypothetical protein